jgi:hypothetical protein
MDQLPGRHALVNVDTEILLISTRSTSATSRLPMTPSTATPGPRYIAGVSGVGEEVGEEVVGARPGAEVRESYRSSVFLQLRAPRPLSPVYACTIVKQ